MEDIKKTMEDNLQKAYEDPNFKGPGPDDQVMFLRLSNYPEGTKVDFYKRLADNSYLQTKIMGDDSLSVQIGKDGEAEVFPVRTNSKGRYWIADVLGVSCFVSPGENRHGSYLIVKARGPMPTEQTESFAARA